jgi:predicted DNA-binding transcriptional regulator AlpA
MNAKHFTLTAVRAVPPSSLELTYADGAVLHLDVKPLIARYPTLKRLAKADVFTQAKVDEWGASVTWAEDDSLELAADNLRARAVEQAGGYSHEVIWNWMARHDMTLDAAAEALGLSRRMLAYYRSGEKPVPRTVALACLGWEAEQRLAA